jgi:hypothetical protein
MLQKLNRVAKALLAFGVPAGVLVADLSGQWLDVTADGTIVASEWQLLAVAVIAGLAVFFKRNAPPV